jgi:hypothetical protein
VKPHDMQRSEKAQLFVWTCSTVSLYITLSHRWNMHA